MLQLPNELIYQVCSSITNIKKLLSLELVCKHYRDSIRKIKWNTFTLIIKSDSMLDKMLQNHMFTKLLFSYDITDESVIKLINCDTLYLNKPSVSDTSVSKLINCQILHLRGSSITDKSVLNLVNCQILNLSATSVTDKSVSKLINCHEIYLYDTNITANCVRELRNQGVIVNQ